MKTFLFEKEIRMFGIKRSGNNALIMYVSGHFDPQTNFVLMSNTDFSFRSRTGRGGPFQFWEKIALLESRNKGIDKYLMVTTENYDLAEIRRRDDDRKYCFNKDRHWYAEDFATTHFARAAYYILLLRSPHNNLASIMEKGWFHIFPDFADLWVKYAREAVGETNYLYDVIPCLFDKWFTYPDYRRELSEKLDLDHNDSGLDRIRPGRKSSFDGNKYSREAQKMKVLDRWKVYRKNEEYLNVLRNDELIDLTERLFGYNLREILDL